MTEQSEHINVTGSRAKRLSYPQQKRAILEEVAIKPASKNEVTLKTLYSGISRGTESLVYNGKVPVSEWSRMRCPHMSGDFGFPVSYGYACVAQVEEAGSSVTGLRPGDVVFLLHPHQDKMTVEANACIELPRGIPHQRAVLAANMETALNAVWDAEVDRQTSESCAVVGAGVVGLLTAVALKHVTGMKPLVIDIDERKRTITDALGFEFKTPDSLQTFNTGEFQTTFHTSASASGLQTAIDHSAFEGTIVEMSWYGVRSTAINLGGAFHAKRLTIRSSQVGTIARSHRNELNFSDRLNQALVMLENPKLDVLLEQPIEFENLPDHVEAIFNSDRLCQLVSFR